MPGIAALGMVVQFGTTTGTATTATLTNVTNVSGFDSDTEEIDVTSHDSVGSYREFVPSFIDAGEVQVDYNFNPNEATHRSTSGGVLWLRDQRIETTWVVKFPGTPSHKVSFRGFVKSSPIDAPFDDKLSSTLTIRRTGSSTWTYGT